MSTGSTSEKVMQVSPYTLREAEFDLVPQDSHPKPEDTIPTLEYGVLLERGNFSDVIKATYHLILY